MYRRGSAAAAAAPVQMYSEARRGSGVPDVYSPEGRRGSQQIGGRNYGESLTIRNCESRFNYTYVRTLKCHEEVKY